MSIELPYTDRVGLMLDRLPVGGIFDIAKNVKQENWESFIEIVKSYIDRRMGWQSGWELEFNSYYSRIRKINIKLEKQKQDVYNPNKIPAVRSGRKGVVQNRGTFDEAPEVD